jgi:hypothetical protein
MQRLQERSLEDLLRHDATSWMDLVHQLDDRTRGPASYQVALRGRIIIEVVSQQGEQKSGEDNPCSITFASRRSESQDEA